MYEQLTRGELAALQGMLFNATEDAYRTARINGGNPGWVQDYRPVHRELGHLFLEVGTELLERLAPHAQAA